MLIAVAMLLAVQAADVADVPLPRARPPMPATTAPHGPPTDCDRRLLDMAVFEPKPSLSGPGLCGGEDLVSLTAVRLANGAHVAVHPPALLRCEMAESFVAWLRDEVAPRLASRGGGLAAVQQEDSYECRNRYRAVSGKISEHAHGNAIDVSAFVLADKHAVSPTDVNESKELRAELRATACRRFTTVLGPGEPAHDSHIHLDALERRGGYRICSWQVREPPPPHTAKTDEAATDAAVPLPPPSAKTDEAAAEVTVPLPPPRPQAASLLPRRSGRHRPAAHFRRWLQFPTPL